MNVASGESTQAGALIINADDWGRSVETTDRILKCVLLGSVSSVSAMVFMEDSERAASLAHERGVDAGLHLNFTTPFSAVGFSPHLLEHQQRLCTYLLRNRLAQVLYHPGLTASFRYVVAAQVDEFCRLYGAEPIRVDGHHHMHLCANVLGGDLLPFGTIARRNFSFKAGEKAWINRFYRKLVDLRLAKRHRLTDFLFSLAPLHPPERLDRIIAIAERAVVELEAHPGNEEEYRFLTGAEFLQRLSMRRTGSWSAVPENDNCRGKSSHNGER
jgi:hypothetical protein